jgi:hypothetical protein
MEMIDLKRQREQQVKRNPQRCAFFLRRFCGPFGIRNIFSCLDTREKIIKFRIRRKIVRAPRHAVVKNREQIVFGDSRSKWTFFGWVARWVSVRLFFGYDSTMVHAISLSKPKERRLRFVRKTGYYHFCLC